MPNAYRRTRITGPLGKIDSKAGNFGNALSLLFDGVDEFVNFGDMADFERTDSFTISCWIKTSSVSAGNLMIMSRMDSDVTARGWLLNIEGGSDIVEFFLSNTLLSNSIYIQGATDIIDGGWHHIVVTYNGSSTAAGAIIYIDGVAETPVVVFDTLSATTSVVNNHQVSGRDGTDSTFEGNIDEPSLWDKVLSPSEITEIYNSGKPGNLNDHSAVANLTSWARCGDGDTFPTLLNSVSGSNSGTMTNMEAGDITTDTP